MTFGTIQLARPGRIGGAEGKPVPRPRPSRRGSSRRARRARRSCACPGPGARMSRAAASSASPTRRARRTSAIRSTIRRRPRSTRIITTATSTGSCSKATCYDGRRRSPHADGAGRLPPDRHGSPSRHAARRLAREGGLLRDHAGRREARRPSVEPHAWPRPVRCRSESDTLRRAIDGRCREQYAVPPAQRACGPDRRPPALPGRRGDRHRHGGAVGGARRRRLPARPERRADALHRRAVGRRDAARCANATSW